MAVIDPFSPAQPMAPNEHPSFARRRYSVFRLDGTPETSH